MACRTSKPVGISGVTIESWFPSPPSRTGWRPGGKKAERIVLNEYLDQVFAHFSGYIAIDEIYDGPYCILSLVDSRRHQRLLYEVLDHSPEHQDIIAFLKRFQTILQRRNKTLQGITTDGSPLYPEPIKKLFPEVPHQSCEFHIIKKMNKAVLRSVAQVRKQLTARMPTVKRGRPKTKKQKKRVRERKRLQEKVSDLFEHRHHFVRRKLTPAQRRTFLKATRGLPHLRLLREIMDEIYRLFDRRCRTETALVKLAQLRSRVRRCPTISGILHKLQTPNLERALTFLDNKLLPSTSNSVERANRRHRKMQKTVYRVRTLDNIRRRIALDMIRDLRQLPQDKTMKSLHKNRAA